METLYQKDLNFWEIPTWDNQKPRLIIDKTHSM